MSLAHDRIAQGFIDEGAEDPEARSRCASPVHAPGDEHHRDRIGRHLDGMDVETALLGSHEERWTPIRPAAVGWRTDGPMTVSGSTAATRTPGSPAGARSTWNPWPCHGVFSCGNRVGRRLR